MESIFAVIRRMEAQRKARRLAVQLAHREACRQASEAAFERMAAASDLLASAGYTPQRFADFQSLYARWESAHARWVAAMRWAPA